MKNLNVLVVAAVFMVAMVGFVGCGSPIETVDGDREVAQDGDESVEDIDNMDVIEETDGDTEETDGDTIDPVGCTTHEECDDRNWCTGADWCENGFCQHRYPEDRCREEGYCNNSLQACTECLEDAHCDGGVCEEGECVECRSHSDCPEDGDTTTIVVCEEGVCGFVEGCREDSDCPEDEYPWTVAVCKDSVCEQSVRCNGVDIVVDEVKTRLYASFAIKKDDGGYYTEFVREWRPPYNGDSISVPPGQECLIYEGPSADWVGWPSNSFYLGYGTDGQPWSSGPKLLRTLFPNWQGGPLADGYGMVFWGPDWSLEDE